MKALKYIFFIILIGLIVGAIYVATQPSSYNFSRSKVINAPKEVTFNLVNDYRSWPRFSPWLEQDKDTKLTYNDEIPGLNSSYTWESDIIGQGQMTTTQVHNTDSIKQRLDFLKPFESTANINWTFETTKEGTKVTWQMEGQQDFMTKLYTTISGSIEKNTGPDFERGLHKLDSIATADIKVYSVNVEGLTEHSGGFYLYNTTATNMQNFQSKMQSQIANLMTFISQHKITTTGNLFVIYHKWDMKNNSVLFSCAYNTPSKVISTDANILTGQLEPFKAVKTTLNGDYSNLKEAWETTDAFIKKNNLEQDEKGIAIESYINMPNTTPNPAYLKTEIYIQVK